jgi:hypothetical protein
VAASVDGIPPSQGAAAVLSMILAFAPAVSGVTAVATTTAPASAPTIAEEAKVLAKALANRFGPAYSTQIDDRRHLVYVSALDKVTSRYVMSVLAAYYDAQRQLLFQPGRQWNVVVILPTLADFRRLAPDAKVLGLYQHSMRTLLSISLSNVLLHEFTHAMHHQDQASVNQRHAIWVAEGLATLYQQSRAKGAKVEILTDSSLLTVRKAIEDGQALPLAELFEMDQKAFMKRPELSYLQARAVMLYLYRQGKLKGFYQAYKDTFSQDPTGRLAMEEALGKKLEDIEANWRKWVVSQDVWRPGVSRKALLGIRMEADEGGVRVTRLLPGSVAQSSGRLRIGDVITAIAGRDTPTPAALTEVVRSLLPGEIVDIVVIRDGRATVIHQLLGATGR